MVISILEITIEKENYEINFDKDKNSKNTVYYKFRKKVTYGRTNTKNKKI